MLTRTRAQDREEPVVGAVREDPLEPEETALERALVSVLVLTDSMKRRWKLFAVLFLAILAPLILAILLQTPQYRSTAYLLIKFGREHVYRGEVSGKTSFASRNNQTIVNSELVIIRSQSVLEAVVSQFGVGRLYPDLVESMTKDPEVVVTEEMKVARAVEALRGGLDVQAMADADVIRISFEHPDPKTAADIVNLTIDELTEKHIEVFGDNEVVDFFEGRVDSFQLALDDAEARLNAFESRHQPFTSENAEGGLLQRRTELQTALRDEEKKIAEVRLGSLEKGGAVQDAELELLSLRSDEQRFTGELKRRAQERIRVLSKFLADRRYATQSEIRTLQAKHDAIAAELSELDAQFETLPGLSSEHRALLRDRDSIEEQYRTYLQRLHDARISNEMDREKIASIRLIQKAVPPLSPSSPFKPKLQMGVAVVLALVVAFLATTFFDALQAVSHRRRREAA